jgi:hypothetical protein
MTFAGVYQILPGKCVCVLTTSHVMASQRLSLYRLPPRSSLDLTPALLSILHPKLSSSINRKPLIHAHILAFPTIQLHIPPLSSLIARLVHVHAHYRFD